MTKQYFPLDKSERTQEWAMLSFLATFFLTIIAGVYTQAHNINFDAVLIPVLMFSAGLFYLLNGLNTFSKGNLVLKYSLYGLPQLLQYMLRRWASLTPEKARTIAVVSFGFLSLLIATVLFSVGVWVMVKGV